MEIWSKLLPEIFDINPREILIINPKSNKIYGFNGKDNILSSSKIEVDKSDTGVFNIILNAISAGEIGKISDNEGKPPTRARTHNSLNRRGQIDLPKLAFSSEHDIFNFCPCLTNLIFPDFSVALSGPYCFMPEHGAHFFK